MASTASNQDPKQQAANMLSARAGVRIQSGLISGRVARDAHTAQQGPENAGLKHDTATATNSRKVTDNPLTRRFKLIKPHMVGDLARRHGSGHYVLHPDDKHGL